MGGLGTRRGRAARDVDRGRAARAGAHISGPRAHGFQVATARACRRRHPAAARRREHLLPDVLRRPRATESGHFRGAARVPRPRARNSRAIASGLHGDRTDDGSARVDRARRSRTARGRGGARASDARGVHRCGCDRHAHRRARNTRDVVGALAPIRRRCTPQVDPAEDILASRKIVAHADRVPRAARGPGSESVSWLSARIFSRCSSST